MEGGRFQTTRQLRHGAAQIVQQGKALTEKPRDGRTLLKEDERMEKGYIRKIDSAEEKPSRKWHLPHFPVVRPDRATTKTRIVFDASAKCDGISLNDALICNIAEMYLRIEVAPKGRSCQRF